MRARRAARIYAKPLPVDLDEAIRLLMCNETIEQAARRLGVEEQSIYMAARRKGTPEQQARIAQAADQMREIRLGLARAS